MIDLDRARPYLRDHSGKLFVIKVGGECLATPSRLARVASELATLQALGPRLLIVHGAGPQTDELQRAAGEEPRKYQGRRVTTPLAMQALRRATQGELNPAFTAALTASGVDAVGLCAASANLLFATRRPPTVMDGEVVDFGQVGDLVRVNTAPLEALLASGCAPVVAPPASDGQGGFLNVNADLAAAQLATALGAHKLVLMTGVDGVLLDPSDPESVASTLTAEELQELQTAGHLRGGMAVKAQAALMAIAGNVPRVHIVAGKRSGALLEELYTSQGSGTLITLQAESSAEEDTVQKLTGALS